jgi:GntR family transcriptional repressor for pyruvate dehydrogenase complex
LQFLAALNVIEIRHGGGCFVRVAPSEVAVLRAGWRHWVSEHRTRILEALEARLGCEVFVAQLAARRIGPKELAQLVEALRTMKAASEGRDAPTFVQGDLAFHAALLEATGNKTLQEIFGALGEQLIPERAAITDVAGRASRSFAEHCAIYEAVQRGDAEAAGLAMRQHLESVRHDVLVHLLGNAENSNSEPSGANSAVRPK